MRQLVWTMALAACAPSTGGGESGESGGGDTAASGSWQGSYSAATRVEQITPAHGVPLTVQAWYPSHEPPADPHRYDGLVAGGATEGLAAACDAPRPVLVFSHGNGGMRWQSIWLTEALAAMGWVVVAPDHTHNTAFDLDDDEFAGVVFRRPVDVVATYDWLVESLGAAGGPLEGCVDPAAGYAIAGHSFGGYTTYAVAGAAIDRDASAAFCAEYGGWLCDEVALYFEQHPEEARVDLSDDRAWAGVPMTPAAYDALVGGLADISVPMLTWGGGRDTVTPVPTVVRPLHAALTTEPAYLGVVEDAGHYTFSDACSLLGGFPDCEPPYRDPAEVHAIVLEATVSFLLRAMGEEAPDPAPDDAGTTWEE